jgi:hypothetical protein
MNTIYKRWENFFDCYRLICFLFHNLEVTKIKDKLTGREKEFCSSFVSTGSAELSAKRAGYLKNAEQVGEKLLGREDISCEIERLAERRKRSLANAAEAGYRRLAFGGISDAVSLLYMDNPSKSQLDNMDLFLVSEIKRPKDGAMEIKFFDRLKALEKIENGRGESENAKSLYDVISESAKTLRSDGSGN